MKKNKFILFTIFALFFNFNVHTFENKILVKVDNEIITTVDIFKETQYLAAINKDIQQLSNEKVFDIAKESLISSVSPLKAKPKIPIFLYL